MKKKFKITEDKILEYNEKAVKDTHQLIEDLNEDLIYKHIENLSKNNKSDLMTFPSKGKRLWLEVDVVDTYSAALIYKWLYDISKYDEKNIMFLGCILNSIHFSMPSDYTDDEKYYIRQLYNKVIGE